MQSHSISSTSFAHLTRPAVWMLCLSIFFSDIPANASKFPEVRAAAAPWTIPENLGRAEETFLGRHPKKIIFIQDAHDSLEAQEKIAALIHHFVRTAAVKKVFQEGYAGPIPSDAYFGFFTADASRELAAYFLMDQLRIGGAEYAHITRSKDFALLGIDDMRLNLANVDSYNKTASLQNETEEDLAVFEREIELLANRYFPKRLKVWMRLKAGFESGHLGLSDYLARLVSLNPALLTAGLQRSDSSEPFPAVSRFMRILSEPQKFSEAAINLRSLAAELSAFEDQIAESLGAPAAARKTFAYYKQILLLKKLSSLSLSAAEYKVLRASLQDFSADTFSQFAASATGRPAVFSRRWEKGIAYALRFYELAEKRDVAVKKRLDEFFKTPGEETAVLVFGGFHRDAIREILRNSGVSYTIIAPFIHEFSGVHRRRYRERMTESWGERLMPAAPWASAVRSPSDFVLARQSADGPHRFLAFLKRLDAAARQARGSTKNDRILSMSAWIEAHRRTAVPAADASSRSELRARPPQRMENLRGDLLNLLNADDPETRAQIVDRMVPRLKAADSTVRRAFKGLLGRLLKNRHEESALAAIGSGLHQTDAGQRARFRTLYEHLYDRNGALKKEIPPFPANLRQQYPLSGTHEMMLNGKKHTFTLERLEQISPEEMDEIRSIYNPHNLQLFFNSLSKNRDKKIPPQNALFVARDDRGKIAGYALAFSDPNEKLLGLAASAVREKDRGRGLGMRLLLERLNWGLENRSVQAKTYIGEKGRAQGWHWQLLSLGGKIITLRVQDLLPEFGPNSRLEQEIRENLLLAQQKPYPKSKAALEKILKSNPGMQIIITLDLNKDLIRRLQRKLQAAASSSSPQHDTAEPPPDGRRGSSPRSELRSSILLDELVRKITPPHLGPHEVIRNIPSDLRIENRSDNSLAIRAMLENALNGRRFHQEISGENDLPPVRVSAVEKGGEVELFMTNPGTLDIDAFRQQAKETGVWRLIHSSGNYNSWPYTYIAAPAMFDEPMPYRLMSGPEVDALTADELLFRVKGLDLRAEHALSAIGFGSSDLTGGLGPSLRLVWQLMTRIDPKRPMRYETSGHEREPSVTFSIRFREAADPPGRTSRSSINPAERQTLSADEWLEPQTQDFVDALWRDVRKVSHFTPEIQQLLESGFDIYAGNKDDLLRSFTSMQSHENHWSKKLPSDLRDRLSHAVHHAADNLRQHRGTAARQHEWGIMLIRPRINFLGRNVIQMIFLDNGPGFVNQATGQRKSLADSAREGRPVSPPAGMDSFLGIGLPALVRKSNLVRIREYHHENGSSSPIGYEWFKLLDASGKTVSERERRLNRAFDSTGTQIFWEASDPTIAALDTSALRGQFSMGRPLEQIQSFRPPPTVHGESEQHRTARTAAHKQMLVDRGVTPVLADKIIRNLESAVVSLLTEAVTPDLMQQIASEVLSAITSDPLYPQLLEALQSQTLDAFIDTVTEDVIYRPSRSELRSVADSKILTGVKIEKMHLSAGVFVDVREIADLGAYPGDKRLDELLVFLVRHPGFDLYIDQPEGEATPEIQGRLEKLLNLFPGRIHLGPSERSSLRMKKVLLHMSLRENSTDARKTQQLMSSIQERYALSGELFAFEYLEAGTLASFLHLAETYGEGTLHRGIGEAYAYRAASGRWRIVKSFADSIWTQMKNDYAIRWSA